ncbi:hypothetical protein ACFLWU_03130, partial [Chloroflexota bacterium]
IAGRKIGLYKSVIRNLPRLVDGLPAFSISGILLSLPQMKTGDLETILRKHMLQDASEFKVSWDGE